MKWIDEQVDGQGMVERQFEVMAHGRRVPGVLWTPQEAARERPLVLIGHGGSQHKKSAGPLGLARTLVQKHGCAVVAIDGPVHGDRRPDGGLDAAQVFQAALISWADPATLDQMTADWRATLDALCGLEDLQIGSIGYWGLSMGTLYGVPLLASDSRVQVAVIGLWGLSGTAPATWARLATDAPAVTCPLLFFAQEKDQLFPLPGVVDLFTKLGGLDRRLHLNVGTHGEVPPEEYRASLDFLVHRLRDPKLSSRILSP